MLNLNLLDYQAEAIKRVRSYAQVMERGEYQELVEEFCKPFGVAISALINRILYNPVTINFLTIFLKHQKMEDLNVR